MGLLNITLPADFDTLIHWKHFSDSACGDERFYRVQNSRLPLGAGATLSDSIPGRIMTLRHKLHLECFGNKRHYVNAKGVLDRWKIKKMNIAIKDSALINGRKFVLFGYANSKKNPSLQVVRCGTYVRNKWLEFEFVSTHKKDSKFIPSMVESIWSIKIN